VKGYNNRVAIITQHHPTSFLVDAMASGLQDIIHKGGYASAGHIEHFQPYRSRLNHSK